MCLFVILKDFMCPMKAFVNYIFIPQKVQWKNFRVNPLIAIKLSNTFKKFVGCCGLKGLTYNSAKSFVIP